jgi:hypothetical protein
MDTEAGQLDYAIALWGLPEEFSQNPDPTRLETNAKEPILAWNTAGEYHLVLGFDFIQTAKLGAADVPVPFRSSLYCLSNHEGTE